MPVTFTKDDAYQVLRANGITDVLLHFTNRNEHGERTSHRQWSAWYGSGKDAKLIERGRHLAEVVQSVIEERSKPSCKNCRRSFASHADGGDCGNRLTMYEPVPAVGLP